MNKIITLILIVLSLSVKSSGFPEISFEKEVSDSTLIIVGVLTQKNSKLEGLKGLYKTKAGEFVEYDAKEILYTTYTFKVDEVLKGLYEKQFIDVKMKGGCSESLGYCAISSLGYDYATGERAVLFLKIRDVENNYITTRANYTAFKMNGGELVRKYYDSHGGQNRSFITYDKSGKQVYKKRLTVDELKQTILKNRESK